MLPTEMTPELAEICGIHVGDGHLRNDGKRVELEISGHIQEERSYYDTHVAPLFHEVFKVKPVLREFPTKGTYGFVIRKREIVNYFHEFLGAPFGKKAHTIKAPRMVVQSKSDEIYSRFIRGLFDTDGCLNFRRSYGTYKNVTSKRIYRTYPWIKLSTVSKNLLLDVKIMLSSLGIRCRTFTYIPAKKNEAKKFLVQICGEEMLRKWMEKIGFKNPVQVTRYELWKKFGFYLPGLTLDERIQMLREHKLSGPVA